jgi:uridine kinase
MRRLMRDSVERGRTTESILDQYHQTVKPMHEAHVEPGKKMADLVVQSTSPHSMEVVLSMLANHLRVVANLLPVNDPGPKVDC